MSVTQVIGAQPEPVTVAWTVATLVNATLPCSIDGYSMVGVQYVKTGAITLGTAIFEVSADGTTWQGIELCRVVGSTLDTSYALSGSSMAWQMFVAGFKWFRVKLSVAVTNTGTASFFVTPALSGAKPAGPVSGTVTAVGDKTSNGAVPGATNLGVLGGVATAASPAYTEGNQVALSTNLAGELRIAGGGTKTPNAAVPGSTNQGVLPAVANAVAPTWTETYQVPNSADLKGRQRVRTEDPRVVGDGVTVTADTTDNILFAAAAGVEYRVTGSNDFYWHAASACVIGTNTNFVGAKSPENIVFSAAGANVYVKCAAGTSAVTVSTLT